MGAWIRAEGRVHCSSRRQSPLFVAKVDFTARRDLTLTLPRKRKDKKAIERQREQRWREGGGNQRQSKRDTASNRRGGEEHARVRNRNGERK